MAATQELLMGEGAGGAPKVYIEDVFSTYLYNATGPSAGQTIANNIDLSTKGGMVWIKDRTDAGTYNAIYDTARGATKELLTSSTAAQSTISNGLTAFGTTGFTLGIDTAGGNVNYAYSSPSKYVSWTFCKQTKFFDIVTYTGDGVNNRTISHNLGSTPGCIIIKRTNATSNYGWVVYHRSCTGTQNLMLNSTEAEGTTFNGEIKSPTSTTFTVSSLGDVNNSGSTFVAYLFAHDAGGFGLTGTDNVISCGSFTTDGSGNATVSVGYEPQFLLTKKTNSTSSWLIHDNMRALNMTSAALIYPNQSTAETVGGNPYVNPTPTGFNAVSGLYSASSTYVYIAIRRGPMKVPTDATKVFAPIAQNSNGTVTTNFPVDMVIAAQRNKAAYTDNFAFSRLDGNKSYLLTNSNAAEATGGTDNLGFANNTGYSDAFFIAGAYPFSYWNFRRAAGFFDVVCATGTANGYLDRLNHNLGVAPELIISKMRSGVTEDWYVYYKLANGGTNPQNYYMRLNLTHGTNLSANTFGAITPDATTFAFYMNNSKNYVHYLFASCPGVSKIGLYTGNGSSQTINCGFAAGARFILIKRAENGSTGDWYVWDTARGIVTGNDGHISLNSTSAEVTTDDTIDPDSSGFIVNQLAATNVNVNAATYLYLAIA